jgi:3,4-dihydroxy 2-butanone 4-phosphate synthase/GTP cyclohydrolase II
LASWTETKRLGLLKTAKAEQRLHPSLQLNREERDLASLLNNKKNGWSETSGQPILIHWS